MKTIVYGPNIGKGGTFHVHKKGCRDLHKYHDEEPPIELDVKTRAELIEVVYADQISEAVEADDLTWAHWRAYEGDFKFFPCVRDLLYMLHS